MEFIDGVGYDQSQAFRFLQTCNTLAEGRTINLVYDGFVRRVFLRLFLPRGQRVIHGWLVFVT